MKQSKILKVLVDGSYHIGNFDNLYKDYQINEIKISRLFFFIKVFWIKLLMLFQKHEKVFISDYDCAMLFHKVFKSSVITKAIINKPTRAFRIIEIQKSGIEMILEDINI